MLHWTVHPPVAASLFVLYFTLPVSSPSYTTVLVASSEILVLEHSIIYVIVAPGNALEFTPPKVTLSIDFVVVKEGPTDGDTATEFVA